MTVESMDPLRAVNWALHVALPCVLSLAADTDDVLQRFEDEVPVIENGRSAVTALHFLRQVRARLDDQVAATEGTKVERLAALLDARSAVALVTAVVRESATGATAGACPEVQDVVEALVGLMEAIGAEDARRARSDRGG